MLKIYNAHASNSINSMTEAEAREVIGNFGQLFKGWSDVYHQDIETAIDYFKDRFAQVKSKESSDAHEPKGPAASLRIVETHLGDDLETIARILEQPITPLSAYELKSALTKIREHLGVVTAYMTMGEELGLFPAETDRSPEANADAAKRDKIYDDLERWKEKLPGSLNADKDTQKLEAALNYLISLSKAADKVSTLGGVG